MEEGDGEVVDRGDVLIKHPMEIKGTQGTARAERMMRRRRQTEAEDTSMRTNKEDDGGKGGTGNDNNSKGWGGVAV